MSDLMCALGTGVFNDAMTEEEVEAAITRMRYGKTIIMADADIDGCFIGGTMVRTTNGLVTFHQLALDAFKGITHQGYAYDLENDSVVTVPLINPHKTKDVSELVTVKFDNGSTFVCTPNHPFLTMEWMYVEAGKLNAGSLIICGAGGQHIAVASVTPLTCNTDCTVAVYDLTVDKYHNFQLANGAFVHNSHIECLLIGHFFKHMRPLIERGYIYIALPPLFRVTERGKHEFFRDEAALSAFFRKRAKNVAKGDTHLGVLAGVTHGVRAIIESSASRIGIEPADLAHAIVAACTYDSSREDWVMAFAEQVLASRSGCEGLDAHQTDTGAVVIEGIEPTGRFFVTVITPEFVAAVTDTVNKLNTVIPEATFSDLLSNPNREVNGVVYSDIYQLCCAIDKVANQGVQVMRNKGLGEMDAIELGDTTLDPATRRLIQVNVSDFDSTGAFIHTLLSKGDAEARRELVHSTIVDANIIDA